MIQIVTRNRLAHTRSTPVCKCCNAQLQYSQPSYLVVLNVTIAGKLSEKAHTFTVHVCPVCNKHSDHALKTALWTWVFEHYDNLYTTDYMAYMIKQSQPTKA